MPSNFGPIFFVLIGVSCLLFLVSLFILMPMPYLFSAIVLKVETRGYWKAFGAAILSAMAGSAASSAVYYFLGRVLGMFTQMREAIITISGVQYPLSLPVPGSGFWIGALLGLAANIAVSMLIVAAIYRVKFGKGAVIWLVAQAFGLLIGLIITAVIFIIGWASVANFFMQYLNINTSSLPHIFLLG